jgi:hypothetical protein
MRRTCDVGGAAWCTRRTSERSPPCFGVGNLSLPERHAMTLEAGFDEYAYLEEQVDKAAEAGGAKEEKEKKEDRHKERKSRHRSRSRSRDRKSDRKESKSRHRDEPDRKRCVRSAATPEATRRTGLGVVGAEWHSTVLRRMHTLRTAFRHRRVSSRRRQAPSDHRSNSCRPTRVTAGRSHRVNVCMCCGVRREPPARDPPVRTPARNLAAESPFGRC